MPAPVLPPPLPSTVLPGSKAGLLGWLALLGVSSGAPYALLNDTAGLLYLDAKVDLAQIGLLSGLGWLWSLKFLWAPAADRLGSRRTWIAGTQLGLALVLLGVSTLSPQTLTPWTWALFTLLVLLSATQDVSVDAYAIDALPPRWVGPGNGVRTGAYRVGMVLAGGTLVARAGWLGWSGVWQVAATAFALLALATLALPPAPRAPRTPAPLVEPLRLLVVRPGAWGLLLFVALFKVGDQAMAPMTKPFLVKGAGLSLGEVGDLVTPVIIVATIAGALAGGWLTQRWGVLRALCILGLLQAGSNLAYAGAALGGGRWAAWAAAAIEPFCGGLGTAPFVSLLMLVCTRAHGATQYALLSAVFGLVGRPVGALSGWGVKHLGYAGWFTLTFALALPAFALLPWVRRALAAPAPGPAAS